MNEKNIGETVFELDPKHPPRMTDEQMARLRTMRDDEIETGDTPSQAGREGRRIFGPRYGLPGDVIALAPDVADFFRATGELSAERVNAALREYAGSIVRNS